MKVSKVLLRWYKSFNINYLGYDDRRCGVEDRPWNKAALNDVAGSDYRFIEIPFEDDITTVVGVACSPKSDPCVMRVSSARLGKEILDETEATPSRADRQEAA
jgi:hypothetical protein